ncbi:MAG: hypothetical protein VYB48_00725 [Pseudomonadota bacterium]|jgi:hypothetical protein|nr:hypothetical protein [Pseudomonadota bacterium]
MFRITILVFCALAVAACGPSKEELRRQQLLEAQRLEQARLEAERLAAERDSRVQARLNEARDAWNSADYMSEGDIDTVFSGTITPELRAAKTYFVELELQAAKYNYGERKQSFVIVGMRNLPSSEVYRPLFPALQTGNDASANSILEFTLKNQQTENRLGQLVEKDDGQRWVAATLNFKDYDLLATMQTSWRWEPGLFEDLSWYISPEKAYEHTTDRALTMQVGLRFCPIQRCRMEHQYRKHPISTVRTDIISVMVGSRATGRVLAEFVREDK